MLPEISSGRVAELDVTVSVGRLGAAREKPRVAIDLQLECTMWRLVRQEGGVRQTCPRKPSAVTARIDSMNARADTSQKGPALGAAGLVLLALICQEIGAGIAVTVFPQTGAVGMVALRLAFSAVILLAVFRPRLRGRTAADWRTVIALGLVLATMNLTFYLALTRLPLGAAVTIEYLGPLVLSVVVSRRATAWLWAALALAGVALLGRGGFDHLDPIGMLFALGAGVMWATYIILLARTGSRFDRLDGLAIGMTVGAIVIVPLGIVRAGEALFHPLVLLLGLAVAILSSAVPYGLELLALRRLPAATFSILLSIAPALAALAGLVILRQPLTILDAVAILLVVAASMGAVRAADRARRLRGGDVEPAP